MRAGPLSDAKVIELLNAYFVSAYVSNDEILGDAGAVKAERERVLRAFLDARMSAGSVHAYVLTPDGQPVGSLHVAHAGGRDKDTGKTCTQLLLEKAVAELRPEKGAPVVKPAAQSAAPKAPADALVLHVTARKLAEKGSWNEFPLDGRSKVLHQFYPGHRDPPTVSVADVVGYVARHHSEGQAGHRHDGGDWLAHQRHPRAGGFLRRHG